MDNRKIEDLLKIEPLTITGNYGSITQPAVETKVFRIDRFLPVVVILTAKWDLERSKGTSPEDQTEELGIRIRKVSR